MALRGFKVLELAGLAPAPFCGMLLSDFGASVICIDKPEKSYAAGYLGRGKRSIVLNLKKDGGVKTFERLARNADVLLEPFRPGVMEELGLGPKVLQERNPALVYARISGFGQDGPWAKMAGHDINYVAVSGLLSVLGAPASKPFPPLNILADFAGGGLLCAFGILAALLERSKTGLGQIVDSSLTEGTAYLASWIWRTRLAPSEEDLIPIWQSEEKREESLLDGAANFYQTYRTKDNRYMAVGALEPKFYAALIQKLGLDSEEHPQMPIDSEHTREAMTNIFASKTQSEWTAIFKNTDACVTPVLTMRGAANHEHNAHRQSFLQDACGNPYPAPSPRLSRTPASATDAGEYQKGQHTAEVLTENGFSLQEIRELLRTGDAQQNGPSSKL